jgi:hypothetical protein
MTELQAALPTPPSPTNLNSLASHLNPTILLAIFHTRHPWPATQPLNFATVRNFASRLPLERLKELCYPGLLALSKHREFQYLLRDPKLASSGPLPSSDNRPASGAHPSLLPLLSPVTEPTFPLQCIGLLLLLDQAPRQLFSGIDDRWTYGFFDRIAQQTMTELLAPPKPPALHPFSRESWHVAGYGSTGHWAYATCWAVAVLVHSERLSLHHHARSLCEEIRAAVELDEGARDSWRDERDAARHDPLAFFKIVAAGPPMGEAVGMAEFVFWWLKVMESHEGIVGSFGRYPTRNGWLGRGDRLGEGEAERAFVECMHRWGCAGEEVSEKIEKDVDKGIWTALGAKA